MIFYSIYNKTPLHFACEKGFFEIAELLIQHGSDVNAKMNDFEIFHSLLIMMTFFSNHDNILFSS
jgi:ankyrin repeat protein